MKASKAIRVLSEEDRMKFEHDQEIAKLEESIHLSSDAITKGVEMARKALNEPSTDLLAFEKALKEKHEQFIKSGYKPKLFRPKLPKKS